MTIKEAVELYNEIHKEINDIKSVINNITSRFRDAMGMYAVNPEELSCIVDILYKYIKMLELRLDEEYEE